MEYFSHESLEQNSLLGDSSLAQSFLRGDDVDFLVTNGKREGKPIRVL